METQTAGKSTKIGLRTLWERLEADQTGTGDFIVRNMKNSGIQNVEGVVFTSQRKQKWSSVNSSALEEVC
jgi:hypothetical protein